MLERFLQYSLEREQKIAIIAEIDGKMKKMTVTIVRMDDNEITYVTSRSTKEKTLSRVNVLSASYARGDEGDTLKKENDPGNNSSQKKK
ncbi:MAG: hypothetical protein II481_02625 [Clostridia bacterium]|jgi:hypothetical protein|nr:hypothetical protein [Clostridia bacterium]MBR6300392.1 hypothetical protein [Clostridia bacterium]